MASKARSKAHKPSKVVKPKKVLRFSTTSTNKHRFQSFSQRIAKLKIDPIRRRRNAEESEELSDEAGTYFGRALREWTDLNLSQTFTRFVKDATPLADSLPMVLHNDRTIMDLLMAYIKEEDELALEPLLSLLSHFAHDLDTRFEKYFHTAVGTVASVAAKHPDPAVIEWCFTCLTWLFKYLSRLLAPDLRPLYDLMRPYLGTEVRKPFIVRFTAESLSFLIRKSATAYERDPEPLNKIVGHILKDCATAVDGSPGNLQRQGVMTLLTEAIKGVQDGIHSSGLSILQSILTQAGSRLDNHFSVMLELVTGILTSLIHHTSAATFKELQTGVIDIVRSSAGSKQSNDIYFGSQIIFTIASVRKGSRISDWSLLISTLQAYALNVQQSGGGCESAKPPLLAAVAIVFQTAPIEVVLQSRHVLQMFCENEWSDRFLVFTDLFARLGRERFKSFLLPSFRKFIIDRWQDNEAGICILLDRFGDIGLEAQWTCTEEMQDLLLEQGTRYGDLAHGETENLPLAGLFLSALQRVQLAPDIKERVSKRLLEQMQLTLRKQSGALSESDELTLSIGFATLLTTDADRTLLLELWPMLCTQSSHFLLLPGFWSNLLNFVTRCKPELGKRLDSGVDTLQASLLQCLASPSHEIRLASLHLLEAIYAAQSQNIPTIISTSIAIETCPITLETARTISMDIRRLGFELFPKSAHDPLLQKSAIAYTFGILQFQLSQAWADAINSLLEMSKTAIGDEEITKFAQSWLEAAPSETPEEEVAEAVLDVNSAGFRISSDFECSNLAKISAISAQVFKSAETNLDASVNFSQARRRKISPSSNHLREQALRVLNKLPKLAEKRSRMLVPILLRWAGDASAETDGEDGQSLRYSRKHQKAMLAVFAQFTNPRVLFKSVEVYSALLTLCAHGDHEIQLSALTAIFAWKDQSVNKYDEHLKNLVDEDRFREELSVFLQSGDADGLPQHPEDHAQLMPVLLRLLYGRAVAGGKHGQGPRRKAIFAALSSFSKDVMSMFVDIILSAASRLRLSYTTADHDEQSLRLFDMPLRQQLGMLNMIHDMLDTLGPAVEFRAEDLLSATLICTVRANRQLELSADKSDIQDLSLLRSIRQTGLQSLVLSFSNFHETDFSPKKQLIVTELVSPRLEKLSSENTQGVSALLRLLSAWSNSEKTSSYLVGHDHDIIGHIQELFSAPSTKDEVRIFVLREVIDNLLQDRMGDVLSDVHITAFVRGIGTVLRTQTSPDLVDACVSSFTLLTDSIASSEEAHEVVTVCTGMLTKPNREISPGTKSGLLKTILPLATKFDIPLTTPLFNALCGLFSRLRDGKSRVLLSTVLVEVCKSGSELLQSAKICADMNALSGLDDPNHEHRERGFAAIFAMKDSLSPKQWLPIVHNCLFYVRDAEDLVNRSSASQGLRRFIESGNQESEEKKRIVMDVLMPGIEYGMKEPSELVRSEYLQILGSLLSCFSDWPSLKGMKGLIVDGDDEASVFSNILHIQQHRRLRALRRLLEESGNLSSHNVLKIFLPLLEHFVYDPAEGDSGRTSSDQTILTISALATRLSWSALRTTFKRYTEYLKSREDFEKVTLRLLGALVDALKTINSDGSDLSTDLSKSERIIGEFLPPLTKFLHLKDESTVDRRLGVAVTITKLLTLLPEDELSVRLAPLLTDVSHILRSRSVEARDQTRKTLVAILSVVGPSYFGFILKELRSALQRGYQLHVLSFTVHTMLVKLVPNLQPGDLDHCLRELSLVIMDDIFGVTGQEKDAEEYKSSMKEIKSRTSFDTMELLAKITPVRQLGQLVQPIQALLSEKLDSAVLKKVDDLLIRLRRGVDQNAAANHMDMLVFCHEVVRLMYADQERSDALRKGPTAKPSRYLVQATLYSQSKSTTATNSYRFKLVSFALDLLRKILRRHDELLTPANMSGFLPIAGDALVQGHAEVQVSALKLLSTIMKLPLAELDKNAQVYVDESVKLIKAAPSLTTELAKASIELLTAVLREKRSVQIRDKDIAAVLKALKNDIDEPDRQGIIYKFMRAVLGRKVMATEVYEIMDEIGKVIVTNPDHNVRESARSAYLQFLVDYPQGRERWNKQVAFLVENLKYEHSSGRKSIMELLHLLLSKLGDEVLEKIDFTLFVALVPVQVSDSEDSCRQMASILIGKLFERASDEKFPTLVTLTNKWLQHEGNVAIQAAALQCWQTLLRTRKPGNQHIEGLRDQVATVLAQASTEEMGEDEPTTDQGLQAIVAMVENAPNIAFGRKSADLWKSIQSLVGSPRLEVKTSAAKLLDAYFSDMASSSSKTNAGLSALPMHGSYGLQLGAEQIRQVCQSSLQALQVDSAGIDEAFAAQVVRHLVFVGRCFAANEMKWSNDSDDSSDSDNDDDENESSTVNDLPAKDSSALGHLFHRLAYIIRQDRLSTLSRTAALQCQSALLKHTDAVPRLNSIVRSLYLLTDPSIPQPPGEAHRALADHARELLDLLQKKVGAEQYLQALSTARSRAKLRRDDRRQKRRIDAVSAPERIAKEKKRKHAVQKAKMKAKSAEARGRRRAW